MVMAASASAHDLLIVGPGVLGSYLGVLWKEAFPGCTVTAQTNTTNSHDRWAGTLVCTKAGLLKCTRIVLASARQL
jgi:hypothetical protein